MENYKSKVQQIKNLNSFINCLDGVMDQRLHAYAVLRRYAWVHRGQSENVIVNPLFNPFRISGSSQHVVSTTSVACWLRETTLET